jgi:transcriptional regulator with XRE-family HTH domain
MNKTELGLLVAQLRNEKGITQLQLSELTGIKRENINRLEAGKHSTGIEILSKVVEVLGYEVKIIKKKTVKTK